MLTSFVSPILVPLVSVCILRNRVSNYLFVVVKAQLGTLCILVLPFYISKLCTNFLFILYTFQLFLKLTHIQPTHRNDIYTSI